MQMLNVIADRWNTWRDFQKTRLCVLFAYGVHKLIGSSIRAHLRGFLFYLGVRDDTLIMPSILFQEKVGYIGRTWDTKSQGRKSSEQA